MREFVRSQYEDNKILFFVNGFVALTMLSSAVFYLLVELFYERTESLVFEGMVSSIQVFYLAGLISGVLIIPLILILGFILLFKLYRGDADIFRRRVLLNSAVFYGLTGLTSAVIVAIAYDSQLIDPIPSSWMFYSNYVFLSIAASVMNIVFLEEDSS